MTGRRLANAAAKRIADATVTPAVSKALREAAKRYRQVRQRTGDYSSNVTAILAVITAAILGMTALGFAAVAGAGAAGQRQPPLWTVEDVLSAQFVPTMMAAPGYYGEPVSISDAAWDAYSAAAEQISELMPGCVVSPYILAGIAQIESHHGTIFGSTVAANGDVYPPIIGIALNGDGVMAIPDTDGGAFDGDTVWDRAVGPFQFIPTTWANLATDGNGDGFASPHNMYDAALSAARHLCSSGAVDYTANDAALMAAIYDYNHSAVYVADVIAAATAFEDEAQALQLADDSGEGVVVGGTYAMPFPKHVTQSGNMANPHHDYPAIDVGMPVGTELYAITSGTVIDASMTAGGCGGKVQIQGDDGVTYKYCHLRYVEVIIGEEVFIGQAVGRSGGQPGAPGAGNTTGPHLHLEMNIGGALHCPQTFLSALWVNDPIRPTQTPSSGCTY